MRNKATIKQKKFLRDLAYQIQDLNGDCMRFFDAAADPALTVKDASEWIDVAKEELNELKGIPT